MSETFDIERANDRSYTPPAPWTLWCFASNSWTCIECQAGAWMGVHRDDCQTTDACSKKYDALITKEVGGSYLSTTGTKTIALAHAATPVGTLSSAALAPIADVVNLEFPMPSVRCQDCPRGPAASGRDGAWTCTACGAKAGPWRVSKEVPKIHITNHFDSKKVLAALSSDEAQRLIRESIARAVPQRHTTFDARCIVDTAAHVPVADSGVPRFSGRGMSWLYVGFVAVLIVIAWLMR